MRSHGRLNPLLRGWIEYYGRYSPSALYPLLRYVNQMLLAWAMRKFKRFTAHKIRNEFAFCKNWLRKKRVWRFSALKQLGMTGTFA